MNHECKYCHAWIRWVKVDGRWKPYDTDSKPHNCRERWKGRRDRQGSTDVKKAAANDDEKKAA